VRGHIVVQAFDLLEHLLLGRGRWQFNQFGSDTHLEAAGDLVANVGLRRWIVTHENDREPRRHTMLIAKSIHAPVIFSTQLFRNCLAVDDLGGH
jgi:hypothetical protein